MNEIKSIKDRLDNILIVADTIGGFNGVTLTMQVSRILKDLEEIEQNYKFVINENADLARDGKLLIEIKELLEDQGE